MSAQSEFRSGSIPNCPKNGLIASNPSVLGLGGLVVVGKERLQPHAGRLDLLLQDPDTKRRYEVEIQLGATDEAHVIRCIEYWDIERKRYPQHDHCAVIVAEDILSRFLNVISLFNGTIPLIAIQMQAYKVGEYFTLIFTKVLDELTRGPVDHDEEAEAAPTDRKYWEEERATKETLQLTDELFAIVREFDPALELKYNKFYIGLARKGRADNFVTFTPRKRLAGIEPRISRTDELDTQIKSSGLDLSYDNQWGRYRLSLDADGLKQHQDLIKELVGLAFQNAKSA
jgi:hypothetical protein